MSKVQIIAQCKTCGRVILSEQRPASAPPTAKSSRNITCTGCKTRNRVEIIGTKVFVSIA